MEVKEFVKTVIDNFNMCLDTTKEEVRKEDGSFENAIESLKKSRQYIDALQHIVNQMKQEKHDLLQDVYNKFKNKGYVSTIKF